jgi:hypothetical protein
MLRRLTITAALAVILASSSALAGMDEKIPALNADQGASS